MAVAALFFFFFLPALVFAQNCYESEGYCEVTIGAYYQYYPMSGYCRISGIYPPLRHLSLGGHDYTFVPKGTQNPLNLCQVCDPHYVSSGYVEPYQDSFSFDWSNLSGHVENCDNNECTYDACMPTGELNFSGQAISACQTTNNTIPCNDNEPCTYSDQCADGQCHGTAYSCPPPEQGIISQCNGNGCSYTPAPGYCQINGTVYAAGQLNPGNQCQECKPELSQTHWSNDNTNTCSDGNACTSNDHCAEGACVSTPYTCSDGLPCTVDVCDGNGACIYVVATGNCLISGTCYNSGDFNPSNPCQECNDYAGANYKTHWYNDASNTCPGGGTCMTFYRDADSDGIGGSESMLACTMQPGYMAQTGDCNDFDPQVSPLLPEVCDGKDNNCDGHVDEGLIRTFYRDADGDGYGGYKFTQGCSPDQGYVEVSGDCDDAAPAIHPNAQELPDGRDNNCNDQIDEGLAPAIPDTFQSTCYDAAGAVINPCPQPGQAFFGQDGDYVTLPHSYSKLGRFGLRLEDDAESWQMVRDNVTQLIWETKTLHDSVQNPDDPHDADNTYTWAEAQSMIAALNAANYGGFSDWRLPTAKELSFLADRTRVHQAIDSLYFPEMNNWDLWVWSGTEYSPSSTNTAFCVSFGWGYVEANSKTGKNFVRAVRGPQADFGIHLRNNGDGTVCDKDSGLMWQKEGPSTKKNWQTALQYCEDLTLANYTDWKLPDANELLSLIDYTQNDPAVSTSYLYNYTYSDNYFSSTTNAVSNGLWTAWAVDFNDGEIYYESKSFTGYVRCVRLDGSCLQVTTTTTTAPPLTTTTTLPPSTTSTSAPATTTTTSMPATTTTIPASTTTTAAPTLVELVSFTARAGDGQITLFWSTASELDTVGFNIYRAESKQGEYLQINTSMIPSHGSPFQGAAYEFVDENVRKLKVYYYKLEDIDLTGRSTFHGPVSAALRLMLGKSK